MTYGIIFVIFLVLELAYFKIADKFNIIDKPNERSSHTKVTLRGGGIIFYFGALAYFLTSGFEYPWFLLA
ncbi:MAG: UDP-GlcNAc--UDP-phosphate GlcNAc-1-phosphate transferase, partial [Bacteroides sp.]|nr:UDP-GlcNAc--UDP-phosphate GlcNAc-1-phosphate transferase [Bacteroides sp.]